MPSKKKQSKSEIKTSSAAKKKTETEQEKRKSKQQKQTKKKEKQKEATSSTSSSSIVSRIKSYADIQSGKLFKTPADVQALLDALPYNTDDLVRCPADAIKAGKVHCFDGALLACACLKAMKYKEYGIIYFNADNDDGHCIVAFRAKEGSGGGWGAIGKSNFSGIRYRDCVYPSIEILAWSYFDGYFNYVKERTMRSYTKPISIEKIMSRKENKHLNWELDADAVQVIENELYASKEITMVAKSQAKKCLTLVDERSAKAGMLGLDVRGCYGAKDQK